MAEVLHKKRGGNRKPLKPKNPSGNEANIFPSSMIADSGKENHGGLSLLLSSPKRNDPKQAFAEELQELQGKLQQMQLEKEKTEELLKERDEMLRRKEEDIQNWGKEQDKLKLELKRLQKMKEFQPTMNLPLVQSLSSFWILHPMKVFTDRCFDFCRKEHDPSKPKHPLSAFFVFSSERRPALVAEKKNVLEIAKIAGEEWKNLTEEQKAPYEEIALKNKEKYLQEMELYKQKKDEEAASLQKEEDEQRKILKEEALQLLKKKEKTENMIKKTKEKKKKQKKKDENNDPNRPKKPATSFLLFSQETRKELLQERPGISHSTLRALISVRWKELKEEEKEMWNKKAAKAMEAYKKEMEEYKKENSTLAADLQS